MAFDYELYSYLCSQQEIPLHFCQLALIPQDAVFRKQVIFFVRKPPFQSELGHWDYMSI